MNFEFKSVSLAQALKAKTDALVVLVPSAIPAASEDASAPETALHQWVAQVIESQDLQPDVGSVLQTFALPHSQAKRLILIRVNEGSHTDWRKAMKALATVAKHPNIKKMLLWTNWLPVKASQLQPALLMLAEGTYQYTTTLSKPKERTLQKVVVSSGLDGGQHQRMLQTNALIEGVELAKEWANRPANHATPTDLAQVAKGLAAYKGVKVKIMDEKDVSKLGMGAFLAVAQGSREPLKFIEIQYQGAQADHAPVVLVGKGITFDTGGICLKPAPDMDEMKYDMGGAASVLGAMHTIAQLQLPINVVALIPSCENMPDGRAVKPGDVVTSMSGQTIEILNTDAEGRLILCDALTYADRFKPSCVIDIATLTGACVIALGSVRSGLYANEEDLSHALVQSGKASADLCWPMPLDDEYAEGLKSNFADMGNVAGRKAGSVTAAKFLQKFVGQWPWAHLDIAGSAWNSGAQKGATGRPVPLLVHFLTTQALHKGAGASGHVKPWQVDA